MILVMILMTFGILVISSGCVFGQNTTYFVDTQTTVRLAEPVKAKILIPDGRDKNGKRLWKYGGVAELGAGSYVKGSVGDGKESK